MSSSRGDFQSPLPRTSMSSNVQTRSPKTPSTPKRPPPLSRRKGLAPQAKPGKRRRLRNNWLRVGAEKFVNMITFQEVSHRPEFCDEEEEQKLSSEPLQDSRRGSDVCAICLDDIRPNQGSLELPCGHLYHSLCCTTWFFRQIDENTCPKCRHNICDDVVDHKLF
jgi:hypothetical protein